MCLDCNNLGYREVQLQDGILQNYCECNVGQDLKEIVASEDFEYQDRMFTSVEGTVVNIGVSSETKRFMITFVLILIGFIIFALVM